MKKELTAAERYRATPKTVTAEIVDVTLPSGAVFKLRRPAAVSMLFTLDQLPQAAASEAIEQWKEDGVFKAEGPSEEDLNGMKVVKTAFALRDLILQLSVEPKIVLGPAKNRDELSADEIDPADLEHLFKWVSSGGNATGMVANFSQGLKPNALAGKNRHERRAEAKQTSGA